MMTYEELKAANKTINTTNIKGKEYAEVNQRIKAFRMVYPDGFILTNLVNDNGERCTFTASVGYYCADGEPHTTGTGTAFERADSSFINKSSYIENCETSAVGRALGMAGFGIDMSVASAEEVQNAMLNQTAQSKPVLCPVCGKEVKPRKAKTGETLMPEQVLSACGGMCPDCYKQNKKMKEVQNNE